MTGRPSLSRLRDRGFTLLEVIIAFVILALVLGAVFSTFSTGLRNATLAGDYTGAVIHAEAKLGLLGASEPLKPGVTSGRFDRLYGWRQSVAPLPRPEEEEQTPDTHRIYTVTLTVFWGGGAAARELTLNTLRLAADGGP